MYMIRYVNKLLLLLNTHCGEEARTSINTAENAEKMKTHVDNFVQELLMQCRKLTL